MRRKEREVTDMARIDEIISSCDCCRIALADGTSAYIVPLNFGYERIEGKGIFYFHGAKVGRKIDLIQKNGYAGFELDTNHILMRHEEACGHSFGYSSVVGSGKISLIDNMDEKKHALSLMMKQHTEQGNWQIPDKAVEAVGVMKLEVEEMCGKENL